MNSNDLSHDINMSLKIVTKAAEYADDIQIARAQSPTQSQRT